MNEEQTKREEERRNAGLPTEETEVPREVRAGGVSFLGNQNLAEGAVDEQDAQLFSAGEAEEFRVRWNRIQSSFVDDPHCAAEQADNLVAEAMKRLTEMFAEQRTKFEGQRDREEIASTANLALRRYRSSLFRLLSV